MEFFKVKEVPFLVMQQGADASTREVYSGGVLSGDLNVEFLRSWIVDRAKALAVDPGEEGIFKAVECSTLQDAEESTDEETTSSASGGTADGPPAPEATRLAG